MELSVINIKGKDTGRKVTLSDAVFAIEPNDHAIYLDVKQHLANKRQGTHKSKEKAEVSYSTKKLKKQKGTGGARAGSRKSGTMVGGGTFFGPKPRDYRFKLNKKVKSLARQSAVAHKIKDKTISVLEDFKMKAPKTTEFLAILTQLSLLNTKTLFVLPEVDKNIVLSSRNISRAKVVTVSDLNTYEVLNADKLIVAEGALQKLEALLN